MTPPKPRRKMIITLQKLKKLGACSGGVKWFKVQKEKELRPILYALLPDHSSWANWLIVRYMTKKQKVQYAIFAAEQVLSIFEKKYPEDKRPRLAIKAAKNWAKNPTAKNKRAAYAAASAAYAAADAAASAAASAAARKKMQKTIIDYGLKLLGQR